MYMYIKGGRRSGISSVDDRITVKLLYQQQKGRVRK